jgi:hypothetical protein
VPDVAGRHTERSGELPQYRVAEVSIDAEVIGFLGMLLMLATWRSRHWTDLSDEQVTGLLAARLRPLFRSPGDPGRT